MSDNVYRTKTGIARNTRVNVPVDDRMTHEGLIDLFRGICKAYSIKFTDIAGDIHEPADHIGHILRKTQFATKKKYIAMCSALKTRIRSKMYPEWRLFQ